jgi:hypothetical protein
LAVARKSGDQEIKRQMRLSAILNKRLSGMSLRRIAEEEDPPCSLQNIAKIIARAVSQLPAEPLEQVRSFELARLDEMLLGLYPMAKLGDFAAVDRVIQIMARRSRLMGLDRQPGVSYSREDGDVDPQRIQVEIVGNPQIERVRWLEAERERLLTGDTPLSTTLN